MMLLYRWIFITAAALISFYTVPGVQPVSAYTGFMLALILGLMNALMPYFIKVASFKGTVTTLGLFMLAVNAFLLYVIQRLQLGLAMESFQSLTLTAVTTVATCPRFRFTHLRARPSGVCRRARIGSWFR